jgi:hypothetical protein
MGRFYTGSSDGKVKAWDVRARRGEAFVRTMLSVSGGISAGAFSKNFSKLLIGDATGKVHLIEVNSDDSDDSDGEDTLVVEPASATTTPGQRVTRSKDGLQQSPKMPKVIIPHSEPPPPGGLYQGIDEQIDTAHSIAHAYIESGQLVQHPDRGIGIIQGPNYADALLYRLEAHEDDDGTNPLRPEWGARQQFHLHSLASALHVPRLPDVKGSDTELHNINKSLDLDISHLSSSVKKAFGRDGIDLNFEERHKFDLEPTPRYKIFKTKL